MGKVLAIGTVSRPSAARASSRARCAARNGPLRGLAAPISWIPSAPRLNAAVETTRFVSGTAHSETSIASSVPTQSSAAVIPPGAAAWNAFSQPGPVRDRGRAEAADGVEAGLARRPDDRGPEQPSLLQDAGPDAARRPVHEDDVTVRDAGHVEHLGGCSADKEQAGGRGEADAGRLGEHIRGVDRDRGGVPADDLERDHFVAHPAASRGDLRTRPDGREDAGGFVADRQGQQGGILAWPEMLVIGGVHARRAHGDGYLTGAGRGHVDRDLPEYLGTTEADRDPSGFHSQTISVCFYRSKFYRT